MMLATLPDFFVQLRLHPEYYTKPFHFTSTIFQHFLKASSLLLWQLPVLKSLSCTRPKQDQEGAAA